MERQNLTMIPHAKCACGHTDDMHFGERAEFEAWDRAHKGSNERRPNGDFGWGCKMLTHSHDRDGFLMPSRSCDCRKWEAV